CIGAAHFVAGPVLDGDRHIWRRELLAIRWREGIEFRGVVVRDAARELRSNMRRGVDVELGGRAHLIGERDFLAVAHVADRPGEWRHLFRLREEADVVGNDTRLADAGPNGLRHKAGNDAILEPGAEALRWVLRAGRVVRVGSPRGRAGAAAAIRGGDGGLVRND